VRKPVGGIKRLSVAVAVNYRKVVDENGVVSAKPLSDTEKSQITDLVKEAVGFSRERGDTLNVVNSHFTGVGREAAPELPLWKQPDVIELAQQIGKTLLIGGLILYLVLGVLRPSLKRINQPEPPLLAEPETDEQHVQPVPALKPAPQPSEYEQRLTLARQLAKKEPKLVANVVKQWVAGHE
jgi:flagellar M-ring protein FliF